MSELPKEFIERFHRILPASLTTDTVKFFDRARPLSVRVNTLKITVKQAQDILAQRGIDFEKIPWCPEALILPAIDRKELGNSDLIQDGRLYIQGLSSMIPVVVLGPQPGERILDMCAAPGSKLTQIAARMQNQGQIFGLEAIRPRFYKLKSVVALLGIENAELKMIDARRFRTDELFDRILLDVPCSSEGRFQLTDKETFGYWSLRKIKELRQKQRGLILSAGRLLKSGGVMVYSTCTFAPEENEGVLDWFLRKTKGEFQLEKISEKEIPSYPSLEKWGKNIFLSPMANCLRVLPGPKMEGFFVAKLRKD